MQIYLLTNCLESLLTFFILLGTMVGLVYIYKKVKDNLDD
jgi:hypothetical protein